ncbi:Nucleolus protein required for cell viability, putative [Penicillium digitatum]|uniref:Nucleolus protein required for cell viability, putative n=3 Tax=Penicillium digitatum TaxID=36651 RepID=K9GFM1_PEND2|nr:Nucleolus protein required for cell viability, putative [Penicillium digitatum Pd1]EKV12081.1 Nucleolus protein required for cell viability, putative [Penicillium digitatum PHI26]EKV20227.1 Nucleolus protein required for cell viability, putative [Penicillium digitatum Pd1]QQK45493.1 Nucleolus protein required for cell viability, putative [Penicillium digitatum]
MADSTCVNHAQEDLTDDQIQQLLLEAETRLKAPNMLCSQTDDLASLRIPKLSPGSSLESYIRQGDDIATVDATKITDQQQKGLANSLRVIEIKKVNTDKPTAGPEWFNLPKTEMTPELKRDLQLIRMRSVLDPKRHYKKENGKAKPPEYSQVGTIIEGPAEFFSNRITKKDRKKNFVEETLALERGTKRFQAKYRDIQAKKSSGKKSFYKDLQAKRIRKNK